MPAVFASIALDAAPGGPAVPGLARLSEPRKVAASASTSSAGSPARTPSSLLAAYVAVFLPSGSRGTVAVLLCMTGSYLDALLATHIGTILKLPANATDETRILKRHKRAALDRSRAMV